MGSRHIEKVTSNIKKGVDIELGPKTLICGPNGQGKTSVINAVELALLGQVSDLSGRDIVKRPGDLIKLTSEKVLTVDCVLSDGHEITVECKRTKTGASKPKVTGALKAEMPYHAVRGNLTGSPETVRKWLMDNGMGSSISRQEVLEEMDQNYHSMYKKSTRRRSEIQALKEAIEGNKAAVKATRDEIKMLERAVEHGQQSLSLKVTGSQLRKAEEEEQKWREALRDAETKSSAYLTVQVQREAMQREVNAALQHVENIDKAYDIAMGASQQSPQISEGDARFIHMSEAIATACDWSMEMGGNACLVCGTRSIPHLGERGAQLRAQASSLKEAMHWRSEADRLGRDLNEAKENAYGKVRLLQGMAEATGSNPNSDLDTLRLGWSEAKENLDRHRMAHEQMERVKNDKKQRNAQEERLELLKKYASELRRVSAAVLECAKSGFVSKVQENLPDDYEFRMDLTDKSCQFGFQNGVGLKTALSGAEWASMVMALTAASANDQSDLVVIAPEERAFDPLTLTKVMAALATSPHQVILTTTVLPHGNVEGWTIIELDIQ